MASFLFLAHQWLDANGEVYAGAKCNVYLTGTETQSNSYTDSGLATPHANPVVADSEGLFAPIYLDQSITYKVVITDADDNILQTVDPLKSELGTANAAIADLTPAANKVPYFTGGTAAALADLSSYIRTNVLGAANETALKQAINAEGGVDFQAFHALLTDISGLTLAQGDFLYYDGSNITNLGAGTAGYVLKTGGTSGTPFWAPEGKLTPFTSAGSDTWTKTAGSTKAIVVITGGGGDGDANISNAGGGGGAGGTIIAFLDITSISSATVVVGAKETNSSWSDGTHTLTATKGATATGPSGAAGGTPTASGTSLYIPVIGGDGQDAPTTSIGGMGGGSFWGGGGNIETDAKAFGAGGGGDAGGNNAKGDGKQGVCFVFEF